MEKIEAIVFDMDGVIFDTERLIYKLWLEIAPKYGFNTVDTLFYKVIGVTKTYTEQVFYKEYGKDIPYWEFREEAKRVFFEYVNEHGVPLKDGIRELLEYLKKNNYKIGLASSTSIDTITEELKMEKLYDYFDVVVGGDLIKNSKPAPDIYLAACEKLGVKPENAIAIEDSFNGIRAAHAAGMKAIMVPDMIEPDDEMREKAYAIKRDLFEVMEMLEK